MNCLHTQPLLLAYLDNEVDPSERKLIQAHLAGCETCREDLARLAHTRSRVSQSLDVRAAAATPDPQAMSRLRARLTAEAQQPSARLKAWFQRPAPFAGRAQSTKGKSTMKTRFAVSVVTALVLIAGVVAFVPPVRAQVAELFRIVFRDRTQGSETTVEVEGLPLTYQVLQPGYLPDVFDQGASLATFGDTSEMVYSAGDQFLVLKQQAASAEKLLPQGEATTVNGVPAVLQRGLAGHYDAPPADRAGNSTTIYQSSHDLVGGGMSGVVVVGGSSDVSSTISLTATDPSANIVITGTDGALVPQDMVQTLVQPMIVPLNSPSFDYANAVRLTFITGNTQVELLSNLPVEEVLKVAAGLSPAK